MVISGDRASVEKDGTLRLFGRDSLVVNTGGEKVFVEEVEEVLRAHPAVADALVVGRPSERWGEELVALVALRDGEALSHEPLHELCTAQLARFKAPKEYIFVEQVRRLGNGKAGLPLGENVKQRSGDDMTHKAIDCLLNVHFGETEKQPDLDAQGARRLLQGSGVDVRAGRPGRTARGNGRAGRARRRS